MCFENYGTVIVAGKNYNITRMYFAQGEIIVKAQRLCGTDGRELHGVPTTLVGADGMCVAQGGEAHIPPHKAGDVMEITVELAVMVETPTGMLPELEDLI